MSFPTDKTVVAVRVEGNLFDSSGDPLSAGILKLNELHDSGTVYVVLLSPDVESDVRLKLLWDRLHVAGVKYDEVWASFGIPRADIYIDGEAQSL